MGLIKESVVIARGFALTRAGTNEVFDFSATEGAEGRIRTDASLRILITNQAQSATVPPRRQCGKYIKFSGCLRTSAGGVPPGAM